MSKKNLLNESQVRQFMKLARLEPLASSFVESLAETHGRGVFDSPTHAGRVRIAEVGVGDEVSMDMPVDAAALPDEEASEEEPIDAELEMEPEEAGDSEGRMVNVDDFFVALEGALEEVIGDEVEIDTDEMEDEAPEDEVPADKDPMDMADEDPMDPADEDPELMEGFETPPSATGSPNNHKGSKQHPDLRNNKNTNGGLASKGPGLVKEEDEDTLEEDSDELVEQITKRVAARILKSALSKK